MIVRGTSCDSTEKKDEVEDSGKASNHTEILSGECSVWYTRGSEPSCTGGDALLVMLSLKQVTPKWWCFSMFGTSVCPLAFFGYHSPSPCAMGLARESSPNSPHAPRARGMSSPSSNAGDDGALHPLSAIASSALSKSGRLPASFVCKKEEGPPLCREFMKKKSRLLAASFGAWSLQFLCV